MVILRAIWAAWVPIAHKIGNFQARVILTIVYFVVLAPFALIARSRREPATTAFWRERREVTYSVEAARRGF